MQAKEKARFKVSSPGKAKASVKFLEVILLMRMVKSSIERQPCHYWFWELKALLISWSWAYLFFTYSTMYHSSNLSMSYMVSSEPVGFGLSIFLSMPALNCL